MNGETWLLVCDVDGTLLYPPADNPGLKEFNELVAASGGRIVLALNSGRGLDEMAQVAESGPIVRPSWLVCGVGTEIYSGFTADTSDREWERLMMREWGREDIRAALADCPGICEQEAWHQHGAKLSYYFQDEVDAVLPLVDARIGPWKDSIKKVVCMDYYLDLMPQWSGKGEPVGFLARKLGISDDRVLVAGDSGNDRDMMDRGFKSIIVANHASDLADLVGKPGTYRSSSPGAAGVLEGLAHFGISARINEGSVS